MSSNDGYPIEEDIPMPQVSYEDSIALYESAFESLRLDIDQIYDPDSYDNPIEALAGEKGVDEAKKAVELIECQRILNGSTGSIAGMESSSNHENDFI